MDGLFRRGGVWWARLVVPVRLRAQAGRREFVRSTGAHDYSVGKLVGSVYLAAWRRQLHEWERGRLDNQNLLKLVEGSHALGEASHIRIGDASAAIGLERAALLRLAAAGKLELFCQLGSSARGHVVDKDLLEVNDAVLGRQSGFVVPSPAQMPSEAQEAGFPGQTLRIADCRELAQAALVDGLEVVDVLLFDVPDPAGWCFAPATAMQVAIDDLILSTGHVELLRASLAARASPERVTFARAERTAALMTQVVREKAAAAFAPAGSISGKWAGKKFSEAVDGYCKSPDGLPGTLASAIDLRQRRAGLMLFAEFMGDLTLSQIDGDKLRRFRDGPLKTIPGRVNTLPKSIRRDTMTATIVALRADGRDWPLLSDEMRRERMQWLSRLFGWLRSKEYISLDPAAALRGETGLTKAERKAAKHSEDDEDEEGRDPFTDEQLRLIFGQPHYKTGHGRDVIKPAYWYGFEYWLPLLGLYSGLRIKEASQLHLTDVKEQGGVWCLDINERTPDKSLKNPQSTRLIPLHPALLRLGFLRYCDRLRVEGYVRVSSLLQNTARQLDGVALDKVFEDRVSGKDTRRPQLAACLEHLREGDTLHVHSMDRLARNVDDLRRMVKDLTARKVVVRFHKEGLTFTGEDSPMANLLLSMLGAVAEFERALILERQREGIAVAKAQGVYNGRKPALLPERADELRARVAAGENRSKLAREFKVSRDTLYSYIRQAASDQAAGAPGAA